MGVIRWKCENCGHTCTAPPNYVGDVLFCPECNSEMTVPAESTISPPKKPRGIRRGSVTGKGTNLVSCDVCGEQVSKRAETCPHCGEKGPGKKRREKVGAIGCAIILGFIALPFLLGDLFDDSSSGHSAADQTRTKRPLQSAGNDITSKKIAHRHEGEAKANLPTYEIADTKKVDSPIKAEFTQQILVSGSFTEDGLRRLLWKLYEDAQDTGGFTFHDTGPTHFYIYIYPSEEQLATGSAWIGMLSKVGEDSKVDIDMRPDFIANLRAGPEKKYGLSEEKRKEVFFFLVKCEDQGMTAREANKAAAKRFGITAEQAHKIGLEGVRLHWPTPEP